MENENKVLNNKLISKENQLRQELTDKEIMFIKLQNLEKENDMLHLRVFFNLINFIKKKLYLKSLNRLINPNIVE